MKTSRALLIAGPILFVLALLLPLPLTPEQHRLTAILFLTISWWLSQEIPLAVTGLISVSLAVMLGVTDFQHAFSGFNNPVIFLFMGGFFMAQAIHHQKLDVWIAQRALSSSLVRGSSTRIFLMTVLLTAGFSAFLSNTATTAMFMPIGVSLLTHLGVDEESPSSSVLLLIPFAATIGGLATPIGTPPNVIAISLLDKLVGIRIPFLDWMILMVPVTILMLLGLFLIFWKELRALPKHQDEVLAPPSMSTSQRRVLVIVLLAVILWIIPGLFSLVLGKDDPLTKLLFSRLPEGLVAVFVGSLLFLTPDTRGSTLLTWKEGARIDWGTLLLFGAGISIGEIVFQTKLAELVGKSLPFATLPVASGILILIAITVFATELVTNSAIANLLIPLTVATFPFSDAPLIPVLAVAVASSLAFMLPVGTPPNAIAFGTGLVKLRDMVRKGFILNLYAIGLIWLMAEIYF